MTVCNLPVFHLMAKPGGSRCNLACHYCFYLGKGKLYPGSRFRMSEEVLEEYTRQTIEAHSIPEVKGEEREEAGDAIRGCGMFLNSSK